ncbi:MAG: hypothetical protein IPK82_23370 [Polyangiaceae bacterium]|nr:hypothetical protein [Polyangiaceae bacterium]
MSLAAVILAVSAVGKEIGEALKKAAPQVPACAHGKGANGPKLVRTWPGGWKTATHAKHIFEAVNAGLIGPLNFEPVQVGSRLIVWVMRDALAIGDSPAARIPCNQSNYQRLADKLGAQVGFKLLFPTPLIVDAVHMAAAARGQVIGDPPPSIWNNGKVPEPQPVVNIGQNLDQWLRQLDRIGPVAKSGVLLSGYGKDTTVSPELVNKVGEFDSSGEAMGPKLEIYGWLTTKKQPDLPHSAAARAARYLLFRRGQRLIVISITALPVTAAFGTMPKPCGLSRIRACWTVNVPRLRLCTKHSRTSCTRARSSARCRCDIPV